jgi:5-methylcytosine-specific restriction endonuclease McrA
VTITRADGTTEVQLALKGHELRAMVKERIAFTPGQKARIRKRDGDQCRYCGGSGPFEFDHVLPVALGGPTSVRNGVLACEDCNRRKGAQIWKPRRLL